MLTDNATDPGSQPGDDGDPLPATSGLAAVISVASREMAHRRARPLVDPGDGNGGGGGGGDGGDDGGDDSRWWGESKSEFVWPHCLPNQSRVPAVSVSRLTPALQWSRDVPTTSASGHK